MGTDFQIINTEHRDIQLSTNENRRYISVQ